MNGLLDGVEVKDHVGKMNFQIFFIDFAFQEVKKTLMLCKSNQINSKIVDIFIDVVQNHDFIKI